MGCCIGARTSQAEAGDQEFQSGQRYHSLTEMGFIKSSLQVIQTMATSDMDIIYIYTYSIAPKKVSDVLRHYTGTN